MQSCTDAGGACVEGWLAAWGAGVPIDLLRGPVQTVQAFLIKACERRAVRRSRALRSSLQWPEELAR
eukprot:10862090-Lingulodinium_polyedra.AAC.1